MSEFVAPMLSYSHSPALHLPSLPCPVDGCGGVVTGPEWSWETHGGGYSAKWSCSTNNVFHTWAQRVPSGAW